MICGDGFGTLEAMVVCRSVGMGYAAGAYQTDQFGGLDRPIALSAVECAVGNESSLAHCRHQREAVCSSRKETVAAVTCVRGEYLPGISDVSRACSQKDILKNRKHSREYSHDD